VDPDSTLKLEKKGSNNPKISLPVCVYCANPTYSPAAEADRTQGIILMDVVIGANGEVRDIKIVQRLPKGLTLRADEAIKTWRLRPAHGPDGVPADYRMIIEVAFRFI
jgi:periplasmic protein TonB